jgi:hypothetical protein
MKKVLFTMLALVLAVGLALPMATPVMADTGASIWTDKPDYCPEETVTIFGSGFNALADVTVTVERPDASVDTVGAVSDEAGSFTCTYQLDGIEGTYTVTATDGTNEASTEFTDAVSFAIKGTDGSAHPSPSPEDLGSVEQGTDLDVSSINIKANGLGANGTIGWAITYDTSYEDGSTLSSVTTFTPPNGTLGGSSTAYEDDVDVDFTIETDTLAPGDYVGKLQATGTGATTGTYHFEFTVTEASGGGAEVTETTTEIYDAADDSVIPEDTSVPLATSVYDVATVTGDNPTGDVDFTLYKVVGQFDPESDPPETDDSVVYSDTGVGLVSGVATSGDSPALHAGDYYWVASYSGDDYNDPSDSDPEPFTVDKADVTIETVILDEGDIEVTEVDLASTVHDQATVTGVDPFIPSGTIDFAFSNGDTTTDVSLDEFGIAVSDPSGPLHAGDYYYVAGNYSGDDDYNPYEGITDEEDLTVDKADVTITTTIYTENDDEVTGVYPIASTTIIYDEATVTGIGVTGFEPAGTVDFTYDSTSAGSPSISGNDPATAYSDYVGPLAAGDYAFSASYTDSSGDYNDKTSADELFSVLEVYLGTNGKSMGFWTNKNGQGLLTNSDATYLDPEAPFHTFTPYPKEPAGSTPFNAKLNTFKSQVKGFINNANAKDMRYMLAAQLLAVKLDSRHGFLDGANIWLDNGDGIVQPGEVLSISGLFTAADYAWLGTNKADQEYYKDILDGICNNKVWFIVP